MIKAFATPNTGQTTLFVLRPPVLVICGGNLVSSFRLSARMLGVGLCVEDEVEDVLGGHVFNHGSPRVPLHGATMTS